MSTAKDAGDRGEALVAEYLRAQGYELLASQFRCRFGEIDLIAQNRRYVVFVEVKLRKSGRYGSAAEFVDEHKQERLRTTAALWLQSHETALQPRFDVIEIYAPEGEQTIKPEIRHLEDAFS